MMHNIHFIIIDYQTVFRVGQNYVHSHVMLNKIYEKKSRTDST